MNPNRLNLPTALGTLAVAWTGRGLSSIRLVDEPAPEPGDGAAAGDVPEWVRDACARIAAHLRGEQAELGAIRLDMDALSPFPRRVYQHLRSVPAGETRSYGQLAAELGSPGAARAIGQAMARNPFLIVVPCHRVLASARLAGGFSAPGGLRTKRQLLELEGVSLPIQSSLFD